MPFQGMRSLGSKRAASQWRHRERGRAIAERDGLCSIFQGLEDIDNLIAGANLQVHHRSRTDSPPSTPKKQEKLFALRSPQQQRIQANRMCWGRCSEGVPVDVVDEMRWLTKMPESKYSSPGKHSTSLTPRLDALPCISDKAVSKRRNSTHSEASTASNASGATDSTASDMSDHASIVESSDVFDQDGSFNDPTILQASVNPTMACIHVTPACSPWPPKSPPSVHSNLPPPMLLTLADDGSPAFPSPLASSRPSLSPGSSVVPSPPLSARSTFSSPPRPLSLRSTLKPQSLSTPGDAKDAGDIIPSPPASARSSLHKFHRRKELFDMVLPHDTRPVLGFKEGMAIKRKDEKEAPRLRLHHPLDGSARQQKAQLEMSEPRLVTCSVHWSRRSSEDGVRSQSPCPQGILEHVEQGKPVSLERREACEGIRTLLFGAICNEGIEAAKARKQIFYEGLGTAEQCSLLYCFWIQLDEAFTGVTGIYQFQAYLHKVPKKHKAHGKKVVSLLLNHEKNRFSVEDLMRIIWPGSSVPQLACMKALLAEEDEKIRRVPIPKPQILPEEDCEALTRIFEELDTKHEGQVSFQALEDARDELDRPLVDHNLVLNYASTWDPEENGYFALQAFLEMMCPAGCCVSAESNTAVGLDGNRICRSSSGVWQVSESG